MKNYTQFLHAQFTIIDPLNPQRGYQVTIERVGCSPIVTSVDGATGDDLLTPADCMHVINYYI